MTPEQTFRTSKFLSLVLRQRPKAAGIQFYRFDPVRYGHPQQK